jgi:hypothetical protein
MDRMPDAPTGQPVVPIDGPLLQATGQVVPRSVDLGREDQLVTWGEWFQRSHHLMFRATLADGRAFLVREIRQHVSRGACTIMKTRWHERDTICDVITGYLLIGNDESGVPTTLAVLPQDIVTVECVLGVVSPPDNDPELTQQAQEQRLFGFAQFAKALENRPTRVEEVEENVGKRDNGGDGDEGNAASSA